MINAFKEFLLRKLIKDAVGGKGYVSDYRLVKLNGMIISEVRANFDTYSEDNKMKEFQADCHRQALELF